MIPRPPSAEDCFRAELLRADAHNALFMDVPGLTPERAWPIFAETELLMRAARGPGLHVERIPVAPGVIRRIHTTVGADPATYEEEHFQWEVPRWAGVRRHFVDGPLARLLIMFALHPVPDGGATRAEFAFGAWARTPDDLPVARAVAADALPADLAALAPQLQAVATLDLPQFQPTPPRGGPADEVALQAALHTLVSSGEHVATSQRIISFIRQQHDQDLTHIAPFELADRLSLDRQTVLNVVLRLARLGIVEPQWSVACPSCRGPKATTDHVSALTGRVHCDDCNLAFDADPADNLHLTFRPAPSVRPLEVEWACVGGPARTPHVRAQAWVDPAQVLTLTDLPLPAGGPHWRLRCPETGAQIDLPPQSGRWCVTKQGISQLGGTGRLEIQNSAPGRVRVILEDAQQSDHVLRARQVLETPRFRELFAADHWEFLCMMERGWRAQFGLANVAFQRAAPAARYDLLVIGCGPAGEALATRAARLGARVALVEARQSFGGSSGLSSKAFREAAAKVLVWAQSKDGARDVAALRALFEERFLPYGTYVSSLQTLEVFQRLGQAGVDLFHGTATFAGNGNGNGNGEIEVTRAEQPPLRLRGAKVAIATGARPAHPDAIPIDQQFVLDAAGMRTLPRLPESVIVVGGGVVALEYATILAALATRVTLVHGGPSILPFLDRELAASLRDQMVAMGITIHADEAVQHVEVDPTAEEPVLVTLTRAGERIRSQRLLYAAGQQANTDHLGCELAGVELGQYGRVVVDEQLRTRCPHVFAAGDVIGPPGLASTAAHQGKLLAERLFAGVAEMPSAAMYPTGLWTMPEVATVGLTEEQARDQHIDYVVGRAYFRDLPRGILSGDLQGWLKLIVERSTRRAVGVHVIGQSACELIHYGAAMVHANVSVTDVAHSVFAAATFHGVYEVAADDALGKL